MLDVVYPGFFDPFTLGHQNIVERATASGWSVCVAVAEHAQKTPVMTLQERLGMVQEVFEGDANVQVEPFEGLLTSFLKRKGIRTVLRGLRSVSDFEYEHQMAQANRSMMADMDTVFLITDGIYGHLSSSLIRQIAALDGPLDGMVPPVLKERIQAKYGHQSLG